MTSHVSRLALARPATAQVVLRGVVFVLLAGLMWMHALGGGHTAAAPGAEHGGSVTASVPGEGGSIAPAEPCGGHDAPSDCPTDLPDHPGPLCQSTAVPGAAVLAVPGSGGAVHPVPLQPVPISGATVAGDAGAGSGCGPPSLTLLSISRT